MHSVRPSVLRYARCMPLTPQERRDRDAARKRRQRAADREALGLPPPQPPLTPHERRRRHAQRMRRYRAGITAERAAWLDEMGTLLAQVDAAHLRALELARFDRSAYALLPRARAVRLVILSWDGEARTGPAKDG